jgi:hypothetical protein
MSRDGLPGCSFAIFSAFPFVLYFFGSCEKWFATLKKKVFTSEFSYKNTSTLICILYIFFK